MGYSMIGLVFLYLGSNAFLVFSAAIWGLVLTAQKYWNRFRGRNRKVEVRPEVPEEKPEKPKEIVLTKR